MFLNLKVLGVDKVLSAQVLSVHTLANEVHQDT